MDTGEFQGSLMSGANSEHPTPFSGPLQAKGDTLQSDQVPTSERGGGIGSSCQAYLGLRTAVEEKMRLLKSFKERDRYVKQTRAGPARIIPWSTLTSREKRPLGPQSEKGISPLSGKKTIEEVMTLNRPFPEHKEAYLLTQG